MLKAAAVSDELEDALQAIDADDESPVYLLWGEEYLVRKGAEQLVDKLVPNAAAGLNLVTADGLAPREIASELATLPLFPGRKVVLVRDPEWLAPKKGRTDALGKSKDAWRANRRKEAARRVLAIAARAGWGPRELDPADSDAWERELGISLSGPDLQFLKEVSEFCLAEGLTAPQGDDSALLELLTKGAGKGQVLVIAATDLESKSPFVKLVKDQGTFIERKVAGRLKDLDLTEFSAETLKPFGKKLGPGALEKLKDRVGGNFRLLASELNKLAVYVEAPVIGQRDVELLVGHAREEEYLELSDALQKRDYDATMKYLHEAIAQGSAPLQLLGAITSIVRTLLMNHERMVALSGGKPPRNYNDFQTRVFPQIEAEAKAAKTRVPHPYAAFMGMQSAAGYGRKVLLSGLSSCAESDLALKFGGDELVLERLVWTLCGRASAWDSGLATIRREQER
ncbi:MAG: DNA polymerase III subunit delta [Archangiaceae bacterium]|nr:DNA polymerase III subunit delta [Archangiaceae bacterium]